MTGLKGFSDNPLRTRADLVVAVKAITSPIERYRSPLGARVKIHPASCAGFDDVAAQIEGFCRPLLGVSAFLDDAVTLDRWCQGLAAGVDVDGEEYWGDISDFDQRMVETESICIAILTSPDAFLLRMSDKSKVDLVRWLRQINNKDMPPNNWRWFRLFVNMTLTQVLGVPRCEVDDAMKMDFALLDSFDIGDGWSSDGLWAEDRKQADYYSGSFAIHFAQLLYVRFAEGDHERVQKYRDQAKQLSLNYWRYFDVGGAAISFGRSQTYRFAFAAFWSAAAVAGVKLPPPMDSIGTIKGMLLRHLRWWTRHGDIFNSDGILNIGFTYPNMYLAENYNSPQSVYWCLKSCIVLMLPESHEFWQCQELTHPLQQSPGTPEACQLLWPPRQIINSTPEHHYLLSSGQMTAWPHKGNDAKYSKFAYSSSFGFSVPSGTTMSQSAPDSTLSISIDGGQTWQVRGRNLSDTRLEPISVKDCHVQGLTCTWKPWKALDLEIESMVAPLAQHFPGWHIRVHSVRWSPNAEASFLAEALTVVDAGFAIPSLTAKGYPVPQFSSDSLESQEEGFFYDEATALVMSKAGAGGIMDMSSGSQVSSQRESHAFILEADANTNLMSPRTSIPCLKHHLSPGMTEDPEQRRRYLISGVFAIGGSRLPSSDISNMWNTRPVVLLVGCEGNYRLEIRETRLN
ncbi:dihydroxyacid dehydratase [Fusarium mundagurra]|uniref:Dihydroxyacid dehydratase n=1 Tax=Fusarium mundagurra TaxID=1567541 RepID=A0A8H5XZL2_9HYPO|nr:dihydroxyacid dehydratase [Fusarium mundagurra]